MGIIKNRWLTALSLLMILLVSTACFQQVGDEAQGQAGSLVITNTSTPQPTFTVAPSDTPTEQVTAVDVPISSNPTETATPTLTAQAVAQAGDDNSLLQVTPTIEAFSLTATQIIINATQTAVAPLTQAAATLLGSTSTPTATVFVDTGVVATSAPIITGADCVHEVRAGETLFRLSRYYGLPVADIAARNGVANWNIISIGQRLTITGCGTTGALPLPTSTPTVTVELSLGTGGTDLGDPNTGTTTTLGCVAQYTVQQYDNLFQISVQYGVSAQSIANANGIINLGFINMGDVLCIPSQ
ncbi:MAG: hypothetical protein Phog2KO_05750 [Phototrophicaceae bacterium]